MITKGRIMKLPDIEAVAAALHNTSVIELRAQGVTSQKVGIESEVELLVPYAELTYEAREFYRKLVQRVYKAIESNADDGEIKPSCLTSFEGWVKVRALGRDAFLERSEADGKYRSIDYGECMMSPEFNYSKHAYDWWLRRKSENGG